MGQELLAIIEQIEREKGIDKEILFQAVESALLSAVRKVVDVKPNEEIKVEIDRTSGKIRAFKGKKEIDSIDLGRIAASTARQVIIQRIREAEKEVVFNEFQDKVGELVSGSVYRFDKGNIIVDLLGKAEGIILKHHQSPKEEFKQGQRIRAYVVEVKKESKGPQIVLSRSHPNLVKKLFELEVPEIYEGIVEIKSIARQPGERTKIAVWSKNDKVDSVGACVGMRGNRVRNIVNELQGEKIDIVRYNEDTREYIKAALSPAKISEIKLDKENLRAEVIVPEDQLSLAIGKHGQNVRLASKLIGWELDIRARKTTLEILEGVKEELGAVETKKETGTILFSLEELSGIGEKTIAALKEAGFNSIEDVAQAKVEELLKLKGIGQKKAQRLIEEAKKLISK
ncbi:MAG: transcription termination factor NusA [Candidatus Omnitrophica bacterium]|nr:transcription termination factor NusA [Candidatus Omnitrophota bacterium]